MKTTLEVCPDGYEHIGSVMTNYDHSIEDGAEEKLKSGQFYGDYAGWNFFGQAVWWTGERFACMVYCYGGHVDTIYAQSLVGLMEAVSAEYGTK